MERAQRSSFSSVTRPIQAGGGHNSATSLGAHLLCSRRSRRACSLTAACSGEPCAGDTRWRLTEPVRVRWESSMMRVWILLVRTSAE